MAHSRKTNKAASKRFRKTSSGKIKFKRAGSGHLLSSKSRKRKRHLRKIAVLHKSEIKRITGLLAV